MKNLLALQLNMRAGTVQTGRAVSIATRLQGGTTDTRDLTPGGDSFFSLLARSHWLWTSASCLNQCREPRAPEVVDVARHLSPA